MILNNVITYLSRVIKDRLDAEAKGLFVESKPFTDEISANSTLMNFIQSNSLSVNETIVLFLALTPHISPNLFNSIISEYLPNGGDFPEFGGVKGKNHRGIIPTGETALYILGGKDIKERIEITKMFDENHLFATFIFFVEDKRNT